MANVVWVVITVLNGYKNLEGVFRDRENAEIFAKSMRDSWQYERHEVYIMEMPVW